MNKTINQSGFFVVPVFVLVAFNAAIPLMTVVNYFSRRHLETTYLLGKERDGLNKFYYPRFHDALEANPLHLLHLFKFH